MTKQLVWEEEYIFLNMATHDDPGVSTEWHLKVLVPRPDSPRPYKISVAWIRRLDKRKWEADVVMGDTHDEVRYAKQTFRSLKSAKAWCLVVYSTN